MSCAPRPNIESLMCPPSPPPQSQSCSVTDPWLWIPNKDPYLKSHQNAADTSLDDFCKQHNPPLSRHSVLERSKFAISNPNLAGHEQSSVSTSLPRQRQNNVAREGGGEGIRENKSLKKSENKKLLCFSRHETLHWTFFPFLWLIAISWLPLRLWKHF